MRTGKAASVSESGLLMFVRLRKRGVYPHFFRKGAGFERRCGFTGTVLGPGFLLTRVGRHFVLVDMMNILSNKFAS